jgi:hypothetical protein
MRFFSAATFLTIVVLTTTVAAAECPSSDTIVTKIEALDLSRGSRGSRFDQPAPTELYERAAKKVGKPVSDKDGNRAFGVVVAEVPLVHLWMAINDEDHHVGYMPVKHSEVLDGTPRGTSRLLFQYLDKLGVGRWWVSRVEMGAGLYRETEGALWELAWEDRMAEVDASEPPIRDVAEKMSPIKWSRGAWVLAEIADNCTVIEYFTWSEPGGIAGLAQSLGAGKAVRDTLGGVIRMATEHVTTPHDAPPFLRPDGTPIE